MDSDIAKLTISYLIAGFLVMILVSIRQNPERKSTLTIRKVTFYFTFLPFVFYVLPLVIFFLVSFFKVVVIQKYTIYQFKEYAYCVLFDQFNGYYVGAWKGMLSLMKRLGRI